MGSSQRSGLILLKLSVNKRSDRSDNKKGLTFGRLLIVMGAAIALALLAAFISSLRTADQLGFKEIDFARLKTANYNKSELTRAELKELDKASGRILGALIFVKTNEQRFAKLAVDFSIRFFETQLKFVIYQGVVYNPNGEIHRRIFNEYISLNLGYDLDEGRAVEATSAPFVDLAFEAKGLGDQTVVAINGTAFAIPSVDALKRK